MNIHPLIRAELDNLQLQFGNKSTLTLDDYAELYSIKRRSASQHLKRRKIPYTIEGREIYISILDLATYKAKRKAGKDTPIPIPVSQDEMKHRRGFNQMAEKKQLGF